MKLKFTETVLRDANQSLVATRMPESDFEDILDTINQAGFFSIECWGGATFDSCLRFLDEDPWDRLRKIKKHVTNSKLQMLLRGQNILGYRHYPDEVVRLFVKHSIMNGIDIMRIFDALNDLRNIEVAVDETLKCGAHAQGAICYTLSPIHSLENYVKLARDMESMGVHSICIKDMAGIMSPQEAFDLVTALKQTVKLPIVVHTHSTTGLGPMTLLKAVEAGADCIDTAISSFSGGTSQPATEALNYTFKQMGYDTGLQEDVLRKINDFFKTVRSKYVETGLLDPLVLSTETDALIYQIPGGMLSNLFSQLKQQNALDRLDEVLEETPIVRKEMGYPPLVTPMSQMVGVQAVNNVLSGERYRNVSKEVKAYLRGEYGRAPGEIDPDLFAMVMGDEQPITGRYAETLPSEFDQAKAKLAGIAENDEDVLSYLAFPQIAERFFRNRAEKRTNRVNYSIRRI